MSKSDDECVTDAEDRRDDDFNIKDYQEEIDTDESFDGFDANTNDEDDQDDESEREYTGPILPGGHRFDRKLLCVRYPGVVEDHERAIETLGGLGGMSAVANTPNHRLELRFRPNDGYCKPTCGDRSRGAGFLIRARVKTSRAEKTERNKEEEKFEYKGPYDLSKLDELLGDLGKGVYDSGSKSKRNSISEATPDTSESSQRAKTNRGVDSSNLNDLSEPRIVEREIEFSEKGDGKVLDGSNRKCEDGSGERTKDNDDLSQDETYRVPKVKVLGRVETEFTFQNLCDFQYLPITKSTIDPKVDECIYDLIYPAEIAPYRWLKTKVPYFLPPPAFSRMDSVQQYSLKTESDKGPVNAIGKTRKRRAGFSNFIQFTSPDTPSEPPPGIETAMKIKFLQKAQLDRITNLFEERPIWSKNALMCITNFTNEQLKFLLPAVAYYFMTGPWRIMWVKLGYDPRRDPRANKYQTLDYRFKAMHGLEEGVMCKRSSSEYALPYKSASGSRPRTTILTNMHDETETRKKDQRLNENVYIYREGIIPPSRQKFYQYCDVHVDEIQEMLAKLPKHLPGVKCDEKRGWLPSGFSEQCREIINRQVRAALRKQRNMPENHPTSLPQKRKIRKNTHLSRLTTEELKMTRFKKRRSKVDEDSDEDWSVNSSPRQQ